MLLHRLSRKIHARMLDGLGAERYPGRWNSLGVPMVYCSASVAQCMLEVLVHLEEAPEDYCSVELIIPDGVPMTTLALEDLPRNWKDSAYHAGTRAIGDAFANSGHLLLRVPSAVVPGEYNYLLNPKHVEMARVRLGQVKALLFDKRLFKK